MADTQEQSNTVFDIDIEKVYIKDISYESPAVPQAFSMEGTPEIKVQLASNHNTVDPSHGVYEVELTVTVTAVLSGRNLFLVEVKQAGVFKLGGLAAEEIPMVLEIGCPNVLLPFVREVVNDLITKGGFPQLMLAPVNFEKLYQQKHTAKQNQAKN